MLSNLVRQELARQYQTLKNGQPKPELRQLPLSPATFVPTIVPTIVSLQVDEKCAADATSGVQVLQLTGSNISSPPFSTPMVSVLEQVNGNFDRKSPDTSRADNQPPIATVELEVELVDEHVEPVLVIMLSPTRVVPTESPSATPLPAFGDIGKDSGKECLVPLEHCGETTQLTFGINDTSVLPDANRQLPLLESTSIRRQIGASCVPTVNHSLKRDCGDCHDECGNNDFFTRELNDINTGCVVVIRTKKNTSNCYSFKCNTFETPTSFRTSSVSLTRGSLRENQFSIRSAVKLVNDQHGRSVKNIVIRGPVYHITDPSISFEAGRLLVLTHASHVLFRIYVKLVSKCRLLMFGLSDRPTMQNIQARDEVKNDGLLESPHITELSQQVTGGAFGPLISENTATINYIGRHFDHLCADFKDKVIRNQSTLAPLVDCVKIAISNLLSNAHNTFKEIVAELQIGDLCLAPLPEVNSACNLSEPCNEIQQEQGVVRDVDDQKTLSEDVLSSGVKTSVGTTVATVVFKNGKRSQKKCIFKSIFDLGDGESLRNEPGYETDEANEMVSDKSRFVQASAEDPTPDPTLSPKVSTKTLKRKVREKVDGARSRKHGSKKANYKDYVAVATTDNEICFICCEVAADILFPCGKHSGCQRCVRQCWKADLSKQSAFGVKCPFCRGIGSVLLNKDTLKEFSMPPYRLRTTANINYMEADDSSNSDDAITCAGEM